MRTDPCPLPSTPACPLRAALHPCPQARFKYPPHWVPLETVFRAMTPHDKGTGRSRGGPHAAPLSLTPAWARERAHAHAHAHARARTSRARAPPARHPSNMRARQAGPRSPPARSPRWCFSDSTACGCRTTSRRPLPSPPLASPRLHPASPPPHPLARAADLSQRDLLPHTFAAARVRSLPARPRGLGIAEF